MFKLINRITWIISIILWLIIMVIFRDSDFFFFWIIAIFFVKYIFFSKDFINERLDFFSKQIKKWYLETIKNENIENNIKEEEIKTEITEKEWIKAENIGNEKINILLLFRYNTGGTIQTMNHVYEYLINNNINTNFILFI